MPTAPLGMPALPTLNPIAAQDPGVVRQYLQAQRQQQLAQALMQQGNAPIDYDPRGRISWAQGAAKMLQTYEGMKLGQTSIDATAQAMAGAGQATAARFPSGQPPSPQASASAPSSAPDPAALALALGAQQGSVGPTNANAALMDQIQGQQTPSSPPPATRAGNPTGSAPVLTSTPYSPPPDNGSGANGSGLPQSMAAPPPPPMPMAAAPSTAGGSASLVMPGMTPQQSITAYMSDPGGYMTELMKRSDNRTDFTKTLVSGGIDPASPQGQQLIAANLQKQNWITPPSIRSGGGIMDPRTGAITTMPSSAPAGFQNVQRPDGSWVTAPVQGGTDAVTASTFADQSGKAPFNLIDTFNAATGAPSKNYAGNVLPLPLPPSAAAPVNGAPGAGSGGPAPQFPGAGAGAGAGGSGGGGGPAPQFDIGGSPQQQAAIFADIARNASDPATRSAALARLQQIQGGAAPSGAPQTFADARTNGVQTGPAIGQSQGAVNAQDELSKAWSSQQQAQAASQTNIGLLQQLKSLADSAVTGYEPAKRQYTAQLGAYLGIPGMDAKASSTDLLDKYSSQLIGSLSQKGMNTDAARDIVMAGTPNSHMQPQAIKDAVDGLIAREQMTQARTGALQSYALSRDPAGFQSAASRFDSIADPRLWQMRNMTPPQLQAFTGRMPAADAQQLMQKYQTVSQMGAFQ